MAGVVWWWMCGCVAVSIKRPLAVTSTKHPQSSHRTVTSTEHPVKYPLQQPQLSINGTLTSTKHAR